MGFLKEAILRIEEDKTTLKIDFHEMMIAITTLQTRKTFAQYRAARDKLYALAYENPAELPPIVAGYLDRIASDAEARARTHMHLTNAIVICYEEIRPEQAADEKARARLTARKAEALGVIGRLAKEIPVGHVLNLMLVGEKGETEDAHLALGWLDHFQGSQSWVALKALRMLTEALEKVRRDPAMAAAQRTLYIVNGTSAISKLVRIHPDEPYAGDEVVRLLFGLLDAEEDEIRYNAGHVLAHIVRRASAWPRGVDLAVFARLLANLADAGRPLGAEGAFDAIETILYRHPALDDVQVALAAGRLAELAASGRGLGERARKTLTRLFETKRTELARIDASAQRLFEACGSDPTRAIRDLAPLADCGVPEVEVAAASAIRLILDLAARTNAGPLSDEAGLLVAGLDALGARKAQEFRDEIELIRANKAVKKALKRIQKLPGAAPSAEAPKGEAAPRRTKPRTWSRSIQLYFTENPIGEEIQRHLKLTSLDLQSLLKKALDRKVGGLAVTALRDSYDSDYAYHFGAKDARIFTGAVLRALSRAEDPPKVAAARDLLLRIEEDLLQADRGAIWDGMCAEIGKAIDTGRTEFGPLAMKMLCLLSGPPRENTAIVARIPESIDLEAELADGKALRSPNE